MSDKNKYVVYTGIEDSAATFTLYDSGGPVRQVAMSPDQIPEGTEYQDHFWVQIEDGNIASFKFDSELTEQKREENQDAVEMYKDWQEYDKETRNRDDNG